jgi:hypothetical protein
MVYVHSVHACMHTLQVRTVVKKIVTDYEGRARVWLTPAQNADKYLRPLVSEFSAWLRENAEILRHASATEALLRCVDKDLRYRLKNQVIYYKTVLFNVLNFTKSRVYTANACQSNAQYGR